MTALRVPSAGQPAGTAMTVAQEALPGSGLPGRSSQPSDDLPDGVHHGKTLTPQTDRNINFVYGPQPRQKYVNLKASSLSSLFCCFLIRYKMLLLIKRRKHQSFNYKNCLFYSVYAFAITKTNHCLYQEHHV